MSKDISCAQYVSNYSALTYTIVQLFNIFHHFLSLKKHRLFHITILKIINIAKK
jgi:hypothetical protein